MQAEGDALDVGERVPGPRRVQEQGIERTIGVNITLGRILGLFWVGQQQA